MHIIVIEMEKIPFKKTGLPKPSRKFGCKNIKSANSIVVGCINKTAKTKNQFIN